MNFQKKLMKGSLFVCLMDYTLPLMDDLIDANLINHEYIERSILFNKKFMQKYLYIFMIGKFG
jgi:hypothetical protein